MIVRQPQRLLIQPDQPDRPALQPGHRRRAEARVRAGADQLRRELRNSSIWPLLPLLGAVQSVGIGGEVKKVRRSQLFGMLGAVVATGLVIALFAVLANKDFGYTFQGAIAYNALTGVTSGTTTSTAPWFAVLAGILGHNVVLSGGDPGHVRGLDLVLDPGRDGLHDPVSMIAWSFDRVAPNKLGFVSETMHTPVVAIGISTGGAIVFMWFIAFKAVAFLTFIEVLLVIWGAVMVAAVLFPMTAQVAVRGLAGQELQARRDPGHAGRRGDLRGVHRRSMFVLLWEDPIAAGPLIHPSKMPVEAWITLARDRARHGLVHRRDGDTASARASTSAWRSSRSRSNDRAALTRSPRSAALGRTAGARPSRSSRRPSDAGRHAARRRLGGDPAALRRAGPGHGPARPARQGHRLHRAAAAPQGHAPAPRGPRLRDRPGSAHRDGGHPVQLRAPPSTGPRSTSSSSGWTSATRSSWRGRLDAHPVTIPARGTAAAEAADHRDDHAPT